MSFNDTQDSFEQIEQYRRFLSRYYREEIGKLVEHYPSEQQSLEVDYNDLFTFNSDLAAAFRVDPDEHGELLDEALSSLDLPVDVNLSEATVRVHAPSDETSTFSVGETRAKHCGKYLALRGQISKTSQVNPKIVKAVFECQRCGMHTTIPAMDNEIATPNECQGCDRQGPFRLVEGQSTFVDHQLLRLQQPPEEVQGGQGRYIDVHVEGEDIVEDLQAGDRVTVSGTVELGQFDDGDVVVDTHFSGQAARVEQTDYEDIDIAEHRDRIEALAAGEEGDPYQLLIESLAPKIHGHSSLKLAVLLQLFGGVRVEHAGGAVDRGDSHILFLGDPGTSKSQLLQAVENLAPRSAYASGKGATAAGLTAAAVSDDFGDNQWSLEAGAMAKAHKGVACLDEIDKVNEEAVSSLHDALESQRIIVNKAGINTTLPAQTSVLAAGNPKYGRFDEYKSMAEQVDISPTLISRFDLIFFVRDEPDEEEDRVIGNHIIDYHQQGIASNAHGEDVDDEYEAPVEKEVIRAWVAHAKRSKQPRMPDDGVRERLVTAFNELRQANDDDGPVPVTFRKIEAIQRLAEASARVRLSETVEMEDVRRACELVGESMRQVGVDPETGEFDADVVETGASQTQKDRIVSVKTLIKELTEEGSGQVGAPIEDVINRASDAGVAQSKVEHTIERLRNQGDVYEPQDGELRIVT
ncbi:minichromosome maintenance protein MCM [Halocatena halophila]|uniref:minichromosome maintenance protein MCM n=1 Tax=Halocatena halophila TaxID=2814576 RepID=UPI002ED1306A